MKRGHLPKGIQWQTEEAENIQDDLQELCKSVSTIKQSDTKTPAKAVVTILQLAQWTILDLIKDLGMSSATS